jgi:hypothetical protein
MAKRKSRPTVLSSAARGAVAGLIGGVVLTTAHRVLLPKLPGRTRKTRGQWDNRVSSVSDSVLGDLSPRVRTRVRVASQLASAAVLGAAYAVAVEQLDTSGAGRHLINAALEFGASLIAPELAQKRRRPRGRKARLRQRALAPLTGPAAYGRTTSVALKMLAG